MKISSKSILSPGQAGVRDPPTSQLSTSLSRRLRKSGSIRGGASPAMFPTTAKKRGSFENPEPSSPKVTCIGQVRVRSKKKQAKKLRTLSRRHSTGEVSFRKLEHPLNGFTSKSHNHKESLNLGSKGSLNQQQSQNQNRNQNQDQESCSPVQRSWVHFPVTICDALRAIGSEFNCLSPRRKEEKVVTVEEGNRPGSCGAVFARWLVAAQDGDGGADRDIELVVGEEDEDESVVKKRRHVFEDLEIINDRIEGEGRVSICVPPKNALLLMRCRSDPMKIEALTNRSWEPSFDKNDEEEQEEQEDQEDQIEKDLEVGLHQVMILDQDQENVQQDLNESQDLEVGHHQVLILDQYQDNVQRFEANQDQEQDNVEEIEVGQDQNQENVQENEMGRDQVEEQTAEEEESLYLVSLFEENFANQDFVMEEAHEEDDESAIVTDCAKIFETHEETVEEAKEGDNGDLEREKIEVREEKESEKLLPQCLLMMLYEPKLSMEVSRETWVCSKDFIRHHSNRKKPPPAPVPPPVPPPAKPDDGDVMRVAGGGFPAALKQPARSSCSFPAALKQPARSSCSFPAVEPFVLTRCKSEPMKMAATKLLTESCVLENRKLERLTRATFGSRAAGLGF